MTVYVAFWFGVLELAFVALVAGLVPTPVFVAWAAFACLRLMTPLVRERRRLRSGSPGPAGGVPVPPGQPTKGETL